ncbi:carboxymuconolactone decarboxylase family protein [Vibrio sp. qd031]|uniref:carboxymuconolactone decarboxylase family protein n=1 Tax=Vibrio sp. qd031 TaxID=1603038 RepID=UPI001F5BE950|nr:carboxymuconolactone decarboxylase family protein [Vibrio sp. qd031]
MNAFYHSTHKNEHLDTETELLVGLSAAMALNCLPCINYYIKQCKINGTTQGEISDLTAKVMALAARQKNTATARGVNPI